MSLKKLEEDFLKNIKSEISINKGDELPFGLYSPESDAKLEWHCALDAESKITSVYVYTNPDNTKEKLSSYLGSMQEAIDTRNQLMDHGWAKIDPPKLNFKFGDKTVSSLNRKQKRYISRRLKREMKKNPFAEKKEEDAKKDISENTTNFTNTDLQTIEEVDEEN